LVVIPWYWDCWSCYGRSLRPETDHGLSGPWCQSGPTLPFPLQIACAGFQNTTCSRTWHAQLSVYWFQQQILRTIWILGKPRSREFQNSGLLLGRALNVCALDGKLFVTLVRGPQCLSIRLQV
jgi:hypothetical protein